MESHPRLDPSNRHTGIFLYNYLGSNGGPGTLDGTGASGSLTIDSTSVFNLGSSGSATPINLELGTTDPSAATGTRGGSGTITQNGTVNIAGTHTSVEVGDLAQAQPPVGTGVYKLQGGTLNIGINATDDVTFTLGAAAGSSGTLTQTGGILNVGNSTVANSTAFTVGVTGTGIYNMNGGTANFNNALHLGAMAR